MRSPDIIWTPKYIPEKLGDVTILTCTPLEFNYAKLSRVQKSVTPDIDWLITDHYSALFLPIRRTSIRIAGPHTFDGIDPTDWMIADLLAEKWDKHLKNCLGNIWICNFSQPRNPYREINYFRRGIEMIIWNLTNAPLVRTSKDFFDSN